jgi:hypothetical protein
MANGQGMTTLTKGIIGTVISGLLLTGAVGAIRNAIAQAQTEVRVDAVEGEMNARSVAIHKVAVIENKVENMDEKLDNLKTENDKSHADIKTQMAIDKREILNAIRDRHR